MSVSPAPAPRLLGDPSRHRKERLGLPGPGAGRARVHRHQRCSSCWHCCSRRSSSCSRSTCRTCSASAGSRGAASSTSSPCSSGRSSSPSSRCWSRPPSACCPRSTSRSTPSPAYPVVVKPILEILASIPSVVLGFFALTFINPQIVQRVFSEATVFNMLAAGLGVGILIIPLIASISEDALRAVPTEPARGLVWPGRAEAHDQPAGRDAGRGVGHRGGAHHRRLAGHRRDHGRGHRGGRHRRLDAHLRSARPGPDDHGRHRLARDRLRPGAGRQAAYLSLFFLGLLLFVMTLALNVVGDVFVRRTRQRYLGHAR